MRTRGSGFFTTLEWAFFGLFCLFGAFGAQSALAANPLTTDFYSADAAALVHNDSLFIFAGHDEQGPQGNNNKAFIMNDWHVLVTDDMEHYHDYGAVLSVKTFKWANASAFAGHCEYRNGKFYWYVAVHHGTIKENGSEGFAIGVAVADHPSGPWKDAIGQALITDNTPNGVKLNIDPAIFYDGDDIWMYWGSWSAGRRVKLKENMIELASTPEDIKIKDFFEAPWMHYFRGNYYFSYASGYPSTTNYSMAPSLNGLWTQKGVINDKMENSETNHQAIFKYLGHWYFMYHGANSPGGWTYRRSVNIDYLYYDRDGLIQKIKHTDGVDPVNNALIEEGGYRLTVSHSNLALEDYDGVVVQQAADEKNEAQLWVLANGDSARYYTLKNFATGRYYCPPKTLLDTVKTSETSCEIRIENASAKKGYFLFADYDGDYLGDVLNISKEVGMPVITWVRTGTDNQKVQFAKAELPKVEPPTDSGIGGTTGIAHGLRGSMDALNAPSLQQVRYDASARVIRLGADASWALLDVNGVVVRRGYGREIQVRSVCSGMYFVRAARTTAKVLVR
ncbi:Glycosyl hydrolases family 43 [Fibrobacter sp. UWB16]|uniref:family 43 glycosylhydrolase n=1 Tax=unclassified Fibrobacter TaxID=2634177 RepID=UPI000B522EBF|nr:MULTISPECIES: family 43 glycosylhydrolase [unclassified Fibrobacter]OWV16749.1 glycoside hydrolase [Fibrobacter sp. UWB3]SOD14357.1 Glycosyl hydrolases family 43 [Fibrobacter sp. UWB16]